MQNIKVNGLVKRVCIIERDDCMREIRRDYRYFDDSDEVEHKSFIQWLRDELYELQWRYEDCNEVIENTNVNRFEAWIEDIDNKNCIKANYQLF